MTRGGDHKENDGGDLEHDVVEDAYLSVGQFVALFTTTLSFGSAG